MESSDIDGDGFEIVDESDGNKDLIGGNEMWDELVLFDPTDCLAEAEAAGVTMDGNRDLICISACREVATALDFLVVVLVYGNENG